MSLGSFAGFPADFHHIGAQSRGDAGEVEPVCALENGIPVKVGGLCLGNGGVGPVIDADAAPLRGTLLVEVAFSF